MSKNMVNLDHIRTNFEGNCREAFENMATHMFMRKLKLCSPPERRINQEGIEADPVDIAEDIDKDCRKGRYAYQAKCFEPYTKISARKREFLKSIEVARECGVTDLFFYVNGHKTENSGAKEGGSNGRVPVVEDEISRAAKEGGRGINIHWYTKKTIETELEKPEYDYIRKMFLDNQNEFDTPGFYQHICEKICTVDDEHKEVYGDIALLDSYIEPVVCDRNGEGRCVRFAGDGSGAHEKIGYNQSVREYLEKWVSGKDHVAIICGEPGHGKTSLGQKAVYDFYKDGWLENKVRNVFCFSLNPASLDKGNKDRIFGEMDIRPLLSWDGEEYRTENSQKAKKGDCSNALIFLDGFDELLESIPGHSMEVFLGAVWKYLNEYDSVSKPHIVITTRRMAIWPASRQTEYTCPDDDEQVIPILEMQPVAKERQYEWIERYVGHMRESRPEHLDSYLDKYRKMYEDLKPDDELREILGVPIIFRMIVVAGLIPKSGEHPAVIYDKLFKKTLARHRVQHDKVGKDLVRRKLSGHALRVYADNGDSAEVHGDLGKLPWVYAFYTRYKRGERQAQSDENVFRVGFLHKSFYEYFLASEILSWMKCCAKDGRLSLGGKESVTLADMFSILGKRRLSGEVLLSVKILYEAEKNKGKIGEDAFGAAYEILRKTDGIMSLPAYEEVHDESGDCTEI